MSKMQFKTLRETPNDAVIPSHILLLRSGMIRQLASGIYGFMPLGWKAVRKIENIVREEMDRAGAEEIHMSAIQPAELWEESGRWGAYGPELWRVKDRNGREFCLGPTHEEIFTDIIRNDITSYKQLPKNLYQIQTKYRDEARPRFGLMRSREFIMKDAYSFDRDFEGLDKNYKTMYEAYERIFARCGLEFRPVEADTGAIGGSNSHEFTALSESGESEIAYCESCHMAATTERADCLDAPKEDAPMAELEEVSTPKVTSIEDLSEFLGVDPKQTLKALLYVVYDEEGKEKEYVIAFIRGDRELNEIKLVNALGISEHELEFADEAKIAKATGCVPGFTGPIGLHDCRIVVDSEIPGLKNLVAGANKADTHIKNVNYDRDFKGDIVANIKILKEGDPCPVCGQPVKHTRGIEVGQVFKLGTKYSEAMGALYKDENQQDHPIVMGCYGIGITRTLAAIVEQHHDENGIIWPMSVAPYHVIITLIKPDDEDQVKVAEELYEVLTQARAEVVLDDRKERPGVKFKDADLLGFPVQITVGRGAAEGKVEFRRRGQDKMELGVEEALIRAIAAVNTEKDGPAVPVNTEKDGSAQ